MIKKEKETEEQKPKTYKLGVWSIIFGIIGCFAMFLNLYALELAYVALGAAIFGIILAIIAFVKIYRSRGLLKGYSIAIIGIIICVGGQILSINLTARIFFYGHEMHWRNVCGENLKELGNAIQIYASDNNGKYPAYDEWCNLLREHADLSKYSWICPNRWLSTNDREQFCTYAINPNCEPNSPNDVVLLFETKGGWNQFGGLELLNLDNHEGEGCNILFNDIHVEFVKPEQLDKLNWGSEQKQ